ncbi:MAG: Rpn family recombination-promoting nuclease/putative transposase [Selenomonadaceae bacterium]|nr:Rpn family recombination-promoting nuclease/putative transposase [Selenomonadaceae bacterium]
MPIKPYEELTIQDNFIFQKVMRNKRICKKTIERLLGIEVADIKYPEEEKAITVRIDSKGVRLDVYVNDEKGTVFNLEMQTTGSVDELTKRIRYYQAMIDIDLLEKGQSYSALNDTYIIFICSFPVFDGKLHKYTFREFCEENFDIKLDDGTAKLFLSTKGTENDVDKPLQDFLDYIDGKITDDELVQEIDSEVVTAKNRDEWRREYMTLEMEINRREKAAMDKGMAQGMMKTLNSLVKDGILTLADAAKRANMSVDAFTKAVAML